MSSHLLSCIAIGVLALAPSFVVGPIGSASAASRDRVAASDDRSEERERSYGRTVHRYRTPGVRLIDTDERAVDFTAALDAHETVIVGFIFTTCAGVCPMITANMAHAIPELDKLDTDYRVFLVSLDPEHDTPARLREYGERFRTGEKIHFLTGDNAAVYEVLRAFNAIYLGGRKMSHQPVTLVRAGRQAPWVRLDGIVDGASLAGEIELARTEVRTTTSRPPLADELRATASLDAASKERQRQ